MVTDLLQSPGVGRPVVWWLRAEGLAVAALSAFLYARMGARWWLFAALWLVPDAGMLGYLAGPRVGAISYNVFHFYGLPVVLMVIGITTGRMEMEAIALVWFNHIGVDRMMGYGLKYPAGFGKTHLNG